MRCWEKEEIDCERSGYLTERGDVSGWGGVLIG